MKGFLVGGRTLFKNDGRLEPGGKAWWLSAKRVLPDRTRVPLNQVKGLPQLFLSSEQWVAARAHRPSLGWLATLPAKSMHQYAHLRVGRGNRGADSPRPCAPGPRALGDERLRGPGGIGTGDYRVRATIRSIGY